MKKIERLDKTSILEVLKEIGIETVSVSFEARDDDHTFDIESGDDREDVDDALDTAYEHGENKTRVWELVESFCANVLNAKHPGWKSEEGSEGTIEINSKLGTIELDYSERRLTTESSNESI